MLIKTFFSSNILGRPLPNLLALLHKKYPVKTRTNTLFFKYGRDALLFGLNTLHVKKQSSLLIPAFMCHSTLDPLVKCGYKIVYQDIEYDLSININTLKDNIIKHDIKAVLVVNYFGFFSSNIDKIYDLCREMEVIVIQDNSHNFMSHDSFVSKVENADFSIYSIRKTLPISDGGALKFNQKIIDAYLLDGLVLDPPIDSYIERLSVFLSDLKYIFSRYCELAISYTGIINIYSTVIDRLKFKYRSSGNVPICNLKPRPQNKSILLDKYLSNPKYLDSMRADMIKNYFSITQSMIDIGYQPFFKNLDHACTPQYAIFIDDTGGSLVKFLRKNKIAATSWPGSEMPAEINIKKSQFPIANALNQNLFLLPIHPSLSPRRVRRIIDLIRNWNS